MDKNKTGKYLKYAIGEIILVVIGILIAIQLNNLNSKSQENIIVKGYISALINDIEKDTTQLNFFLRQAKSDTTELNNYLRKFSRPEINIDSIKSIIKDDFDVFYFPLQDFNSQTISTLIMTGDINTIPRQIQTAILKLKSTQETAIKGIEKGIEFYNPILTEYTNKYPFYNGVNIKPPVFNQIWNNIDKKEFLKNLNAVLAKKRIMYNTFLYNGNITLNESDSLLILLSEVNEN